MLLLLAALTVARVEPFPPAGRVGCAVPRVLSLQQPASNRANSFSADRTGTLRLEVQVAGRLTRGAHEIEFRVFTPRGDLYQSLRAPVPVTSSRRRVAFVTLPVAGTAITLGSLHGRWRVSTYLDGAPATCGKAGSFVLHP